MRLVTGYLMFFEVKKCKVRRKLLQNANFVICLYMYERGWFYSM